MFWLCFLQGCTNHFLQAFRSAAYSEDTNCDITCVTSGAAAPCCLMMTHCESSRVSCEGTVGLLGDRALHQWDFAINPFSLPNSREYYGVLVINKEVKVDNLSAKQVN